jgi:hypothetical protein
MQKPDLMIFCDGGIGNRINSLISGMALANHFKMEYCVYWPENNWCQASFQDIFTNKYPISKLSIKELKGTLRNAAVLLHDEVASNILEVRFNSAYSYSSMEDFSNKLLNSNKRIFYYPAIIPEWIPYEKIAAELKNLEFSDYIRNSVINFIHNELKTPFHGIHLRRTDLNVGLDDQEVINLARRNSDSTFFVCSDDPIAEAIASAHDNVFSRKKTSKVIKKYADNSWLAESQDDDGRVYYGNILRDKESVIDGTIDLLVLAHSQIVGYSGSTFQKMARLIGETCPLCEIVKPSAINFFSPNEIQRQIENGLISPDILISICNNISSQGDAKEAIWLLQKACEKFDGNEYLDTLHALGIFLLNSNFTKLALTCFKEITLLDDSRFSSWLHLSFSYYSLKKIMESKFAFQKFIEKKPLFLGDNEKKLSDHIEELIYAR